MLIKVACFALSPIAAGTTVLDYSGPGRSKEWANDPQNDVRYVWADENDHESLAKQGLVPIYIDANPAVSSSWGGRVNDGFHRGAHLRAERVPGTDRVRLVAIAPAAAGEELYLEYGPDYWQGHYESLPPVVQDEARAHYDLTIIEGRCYTPDQRRGALRAGLIHRIGKRWHGGPPPANRRPRHAHGPPTFPRLPPPPPHTHGARHETGQPGEASTSEGRPTGEARTPIPELANQSPGTLHAPPPHTHGARHKTGQPGEASTPEGRPTGEARTPTPALANQPPGTLHAATPLGRVPPATVTPLDHGLDDPPFNPILIGPFPTPPWAAPSADLLDPTPALSNPPHNSAPPPPTHGAANLATDSPSTPSSVTGQPPSLSASTGPGPADAPPTPDN